MHEDDYWDAANVLAALTFFAAWGILILLLGVSVGTAFLAALPPGLLVSPVGSVLMYKRFVK